MWEDLIGKGNLKRFGEKHVNVMYGRGLVSRIHEGLMSANKVLIGLVDLTLHSPIKEKGTFYN